MCLDGDNAGHVTEYINAQLQALHKIAVECFSHYHESSEHGGENPSTLPGYDFALAGFYHQQESALSSTKFHARFGAPVVDFICNHDALLHLEVFEATLLTARKAPNVASGPYNKSKSPTTETAHESLTMAGTISIRVPFVKFDLQGKADIIGHGVHNINTLILDIPHAYFVTTNETTTELSDAFRPSFEAYLKHIQKSGHHILYSLPAFDDERHHRATDFSSVTRHSYSHIKEMYNIDREKIITYIQDVWRKAAWSVQEEGTSLATRSSIAIAEWNSTWSLTHEEDYHFHVKFGAPKIELLCEHEAIVYVQVDEIVFSESTTFSPSDEVHRNWQIAIVVDIHHVTEEDGSVQILSIDTRHGGKFAQTLSLLLGFDLDHDVNFSKFTRLITFLSLEYLQILESGGFHFYRWDSRSSHNGGRGGATDIWTGRTEGEEWSTDITTNTDMRGFQQIIVLSQASLDEIYNSYYTKYSWMQKYRMGKNFEVEYGALKVRLLSNNRALVFVHIKSGKLRTIRDGKPWDKSEDHQFGEWELAFDVGIKMIAAVVLDDHYKETEAYKLSQGWKTTTLMQLSLDFSTAKFKFELSRFNDPAFGNTRISVDKVAAAIFYINEYYFKNMIVTSAQILYTVTLSTDTSPDRPRYAFAKATFHIYSRTTITYANYSILKPGDEPVIVILGTTDPSIPLPSTTLRWSTNWLLGYGSTLGTLALSSEIFLNGRLLPLLEGINRATTLLPASLDMDAGNWLVQLTTWQKKYSGVKNRHASWEPLQKSRNAFEYKWDYTDEYEYNHEGRASDNDTGTNYLSMKTDNRLTIPTTFKAGQMDIVARGNTTFSIGWTRADENVRLSSTASWTIIISAVTGPEGLKISVAQEFSRNISDESVTGDFISSHKNQMLRPKTMLEGSFPEKVTLENEVKALKTFEGVWACIYPGLSTYKLANPFFTNNGDLLVELRSDSPSGAKSTPRPGLGKGRPSGIRPVITRPSSIYRNKSNTASPATPLSGLPPYPPAGSPSTSKGGPPPVPDPLNGFPQPRNGVDNRTPIPNPNGNGNGVQKPASDLKNGNPGVPSADDLVAGSALDGVYNQTPTA